MKIFPQLRELLVQKRRTMMNDFGDSYIYTDQDRVRDLKEQVEWGELSPIEFELIIEEENLFYYL
jgi:hypothetical protein